MKTAIYTILVLTTLTFLVSCEEDQPAITIQADVPSSIKVNTGDTLRFEIRTYDGYFLNLVRLISAYDTISSPFDLNDPTDHIIRKYIFTPVEPGKEHFTLSVNASADGDDTELLKSYTLTVVN